MANDVSSRDKPSADFADITTAMAAFATIGFADEPEAFRITAFAEAKTLAGEILVEYIERYNDRITAVAERLQISQESKEDS